jgi:flagellar assembly factor FliW
MKILTEQFGEIEFNEEHLIRFSAGVLGFENLTRYLLIKTDSALFYWLNSVDKPDICFPVVGIRLIDDSFPEEENYEAFGIVNLNKDPLKVTINLKAPVYINQDEKKGFQKVIDDSNFPIDYKLFVE